MRHAHSHDRRWFVHRELVLRSDGKGRTIALSPRKQIAGVALAAAALLGTLGAAAALARAQYDTRAMQSALFEQEERVTAEQKRLSAYHDQLEAATVNLERRQAFIERMVEMIPASDRAEDAPPVAAAEGDGELRQLGAALPEARGLARIEQRQLAAVAALTDYAERRATRAERAIRGLGLDPRRMLAATQRSVESGMGGPLEKLSTEADGSLDPRFEQLGASLARLAAFEQGLERMPQVMPTALGRMTSSFGYRRDPFTGEAAMHAGLDFGGRHGDPIRAAAAGRVSYVGTRAGYGRMVEVSHGNGLTTRYAHMSAWTARVGQTVEAGEVIGAIGSTGRSTGPHLHFEVRVNDHAVNPRPLLEGAREVLAEIRSDFPAVAPARR